MSRRRAVEVECPRCGEKQEATVWQTLNVDVDPDAKKDLLEGRINVLECGKCEHKSFLDTPFLYHDMAKRFFVQYYPVRLLKEGEFFDDFTVEADGRLRIESFSKVAAMMKKEIGVECGHAEWTHVVFDMAELARYVVFIDRLFERGRSKV